MALFSFPCDVIKAGRCLSDALSTSQYQSCSASLYTEWRRLDSSQRQDIDRDNDDCQTDQHAVLALFNSLTSRLLSLKKIFINFCDVPRAHHMTMKPQF